MIVREEMFIGVAIFHAYMNEDLWCETAVLGLFMT